jgi:hypothetical protein
MLMIPKSAPHISVADIAQRVRNFQSKIVLDYSTYIENEIMNTTVGEIGLLADALKTNPPIPDDDLDTLGDNILIAHAELIYALLHFSNPKECANYVLTKIPLKTEMFSIILNKQRNRTLESLNVNIAERMEYLQVQDNRDPKCIDALSPWITPQAEAGGIKIRSLSGCFALHIVLLLCAIVVFIVECVVYKLMYRHTTHTLDVHDIVDVETVVAIMRQQPTPRRWSDSGRCTCECCRQHALTYVN